MRGEIVPPSKLMVIIIFLPKEGFLIRGVFLLRGGYYIYIYIYIHIHNIHICVQAPEREARERDARDRDHRKQRAEVRRHHLHEHGRPRHVNKLVSNNINMKQLQHITIKSSHHLHKHGRPRHGCLFVAFVKLFVICFLLFFFVRLTRTTNAT